MAEKVISEVRFIETDDGFRIEVKGDKELMRKMGFGPGMGFAPFMRSWRRKRGWRHHWKHAPPWAWGEWGAETEDEEAPEDAPL